MSLLRTRAASRSTTALAIVGALALAGCETLFGKTVPDPYLPEHLEPAPAAPAPISTVSYLLRRPRRLVIDLPSAIELAGGRSPELELARLGEAEARNVTFAERFDLLPGITPLFRAFSHKGQAQPQAATNVFVTRTNFLAQPVIAVRWQPGPTVFALLAAARREDAAEANTETARQETVVRAARAYFELTRASALVQIARDAVAEAAEQKRTEESLESRGAGLRARVLRATAELADRRQSLAAANGRIAVASAELASILQLEPDVELVPRDLYPHPVTIFPLDEPVTDLVRLARDSRPELHAASSELAARERDREGAIYGPLTPFVTPLIQTGGFGPTLGNMSFSQDALVLFGWNIGPGGLGDVPRIRGTAIQIERQRITIDALEAQIQREVSEAHAKLIAAEESLEAAAEGVAAATEYLRLAKDRVAKGVAIQLEVLDAQRAYARAKAREVEAIVDYDTSQYELLRATGGSVGPHR